MLHIYIYDISRLRVNSIMLLQDPFEIYRRHNAVFGGLMHVRLGDTQTRLDVVGNTKTCNPCRNSKPDSLVLQITPKIRKANTVVSTLEVMTLTDFSPVKMMVKSGCV